MEVTHMCSSFMTHLIKVSPASVRVYSRLPGWPSDSCPLWMFFEKTSWNQTFIISDDRLDVYSRSPGPFIWHLLKTLLHLPSVFHPLYLPPSLSDMILSYHQTPPTAAPPLLRNINTATAGASDLDGPFFQKIPPPCRRARESHMFF